MKDDPREDIDEQLLTRLVHKTGRTSGALRSATQALLNGADADPELRRELLEAMERELIELQRVLDNVIQFKAFEKGTASPLRRSVLPGPWLRQRTGRWQCMHADKVFNWRFEFPDALPPILVDEDRLEQAFNNLLATMVRRARAGSTLSIASAPDRGWLLIRLTGDRLDLEPGDYDRVFDLFHTAGAEGRFPASTGLGLYVTRQWLRQEGGELELVRPADADGWGGFAMRLPLAGPASARGASPVRPGPAHHAGDLFASPGDFIMQ